MTTLGYAILGLLSREDLSGYDLTQRMAGRVGYFWRARHSQIYPELAKLEDGGYVTHSVVEQRERPDKKVYRITAEGLEDLKEWVTRPPVPRPVRDELTLKAYSVWLADKEEAAQLFREEGLRHEEQLAHYEELRAWMEGVWWENLTRTDSPRVRHLRDAPARHRLREGVRRVVPLDGRLRRRAGTRRDQRGEGM